MIDISELTAYLIFFLISDYETFFWVRIQGLKVNYI